MDCCFPGRAAWCMQVQVKEEIWNLMNADWLEKQAAKQAAREAGGHCLLQCLGMRSGIAAEWLAEQVVKQVAREAGTCLPLLYLGLLLLCLSPICFQRLSPAGQETAAAAFPAVGGAPGCLASPHVVRAWRG